LYFSTQLQKFYLPDVLDPEIMCTSPVEEAKDPLNDAVLQKFLMQPSEDNEVITIAILFPPRNYSMKI